MKAVITGGSGFIGSHLAKKLSDIGVDVKIFDKERHPYEDLLIYSNISLRDAMKDADIVYHLAATPDVRYGNVHRDIFQKDIQITQNILDAMIHHGVKQLVFTSSSTVYGNANIIPTPEDYGPLCPISLYGASKLACEGLISAYSNNFGIQSWIFRLANIIGPGCHGVIPEFIGQLNSHPDYINIMGNGKQRKSYMLVGDCINMMLASQNIFDEQLNIINIGSEDTATVDDICIALQEKLDHPISFRYITEGNYNGGWVGDVVLCKLAMRDQLKSIFPCSTSLEAIRSTILHEK